MRRREFLELSHHEKGNGTGYPEGRSGEDIQRLITHQTELAIEAGEIAH